MNQYEIRWTDLPAPIGRRPVLLLTRTRAHAFHNKVIVAEVTTTIRGIAQEAPLGDKEGLRREGVANLDNTHVIPKTSLGNLVGRLAASREREAKKALGYALGWAELQVL